ncbi:MAG: hypothetical protein LBQ24_03685 [Candidatus Peribacteria bacterium]|jgi:hypothetical protein|nr:hypothetical protein [Candidatus Peribacteria bacterium]
MERDFHLAKIFNQILLFGKILFSALIFLISLIKSKSKILFFSNSISLESFTLGHEDSIKNHLNQSLL